MVCVRRAGKSSLIRDLLRNAASYAIKAKKSNLRQAAKKGNLSRAKRIHSLRSVKQRILNSVLEVDQRPSKNASFNPATYLGIFDIIRQFFASLPEQK